MMKVSLRTHNPVRESIPTPPSQTKVCMHVLGPARNDVRVMREAVTLVRSGYAVYIVDVENPGHLPIEEVIQEVYLKHIFVSKEFLSTRFARWTLVRAAFILIQGTLRLLQTPADIYHAHDVSGLFPCYIAARLRRKPLIFDSHELPLVNVAIRSRYILTLLSALLVRIVPHCSGVITVSSPIKQEIHKHYHASDITLVRNLPVYRTITKSNRLHRFLGLHPETRIVLFQGYLLNSRGLDLLIWAAKFLNPGIVMVIMGQDLEGCTARLEDLASKEGVNDRIKIIPPVPYAELLDWTASADIGLIIYRPDYSLNIKWCLPNKFFEYLMAGLPVLASQLDAVAEIIRTYNVGQIVPSLAPEDIGQAINTMLADRSSYECMRQNALDASSNDLCWEKEEQQLVQLYHRILGSQHREAISVSQNKPFGQGRGGE
jgi:glycosyltransferase involved in cell wall biosynthesis